MNLPRVLLAHNAYQQRGGEDAVVDAELALLRRKGHEVVELRRDNQAIRSMGALALGTQTLWSSAVHQEALELLRRHRPSVVHVHNTFPLLSPALYWACAEVGIPVVQTLHNFRLACPQGMFLRDGKPCESCLGKTPWPALAHGCYRGSRAQTAVVSGMLALHRTLRTYERKVARYIALNEFCRVKFVQAGLPAERVVIKPNFVDIAPEAASPPRRGLLFVGRLSPEKGVDVLSEAWSGCDGLGLGLRVAGTGPAAAALAMRDGVTMLGTLSAADVIREMRSATALVMPSIWYENFPRTLVEAFGCGLPVIASRIGALAELVDHGQTGLLFTPGDAHDLARTLGWASAHPERMAEMGMRARARFDALYTPDINHTQLLAIYRAAIDEQHAMKAPA